MGLGLFGLGLPGSLGWFLFFSSFFVAVVCVSGFFWFAAAGFVGVIRC